MNAELSPKAARSKQP